MGGKGIAAVELIGLACAHYGASSGSKIPAIQRPGGPSVGQTEIPREEGQDLRPGPRLWHARLGSGGSPSLKDKVAVATNRHAETSAKHAK